MITENLSTLKIHELSQAQYDKALSEGRINENEIYLTPDTENGASKGLAYTSNEDGTCYVSGIGTCTDTEIIIPSYYNGETVIEIANAAFMSRTTFTSIKIPDSVTSIGGQAFQYCTSLTSIEIPDSLTSIGNNAFASCTGLTSIVIPDSVTSIGMQAFLSCTNLTIYCETSSQPAGWNQYWNLSKCPVIWDFARDFVKVHNEIEQVASAFPNFATKNVSQSMIEIKAGDKINGWWCLIVYYNMTTYSLGIFDVDLPLQHLPSFIIPYAGVYSIRIGNSSSYGVTIDVYDASGNGVTLDGLTLQGYKVSD